MDEVEITCLCGQIKLADIGLSMVKGDVKYVSQALAQASRELDYARRAKGVAVRTVRRARNVRPAEPERKKPYRSTRYLVPPRGAQTPPAATPPAATPTAPLVVRAELDLGAFRKVVREEVTGALRDAILSSKPFPVSVETRVGRQDGPDGPTFIPEGIVGAAKGAVQVDARETESTAVDAAAKKLKGKRKTTKRKAKEA